MNPLAIIGAGAGTNLVSSTLGSWLQNRANRQIASDAQNFELEMWNKSNQYNSPEAQMSRLKQAGLNPNLVYGTGNVSGQSSAPPPKATRPEYQNPLSGMQNVGFNLLSSIMDTMKKSQETDLVKANVEKLKMENEILREYSAWHPGNIKGQSDVNRNSMLFADLTNRTQNLYPYSTKLNEILLGQAKDQAKITSNKMTLSEYEKSLAGQLYDFKSTSPYVQMILNILKSAGISK